MKKINNKIDNGELIMENEKNNTDNSQFSIINSQFKKTDIGLIPKDWEVKKLGEIGAFYKGKGIKKDDVLDEGINCIRYGEIYTTHNNYIKKFTSFIDENIAKTSFILKEGDLLFAGSGETAEEIGKSVAFIFNCIAYAGGDIVVLRPKLKINTLYFGFLLNVPIVARQKANFGQGNAIVHISSKNLSEIKIPFPPLPEQHRIAEVLTDTDNLISDLEKLIEKKKNIKKAVLQKLLKPKKDWETVILGEVVDFFNGKAHENDISESGKYIVVNSKFVSSEGTIAKYSNFCFCPAKQNDILMVMSDIPNGKAIAKCFIVDKDDLYTVNQRVCILRIKNNSSKFLFYLINRNNYYLSFDDGVKQTNLTKNDVLELPLQIPSIEKQTEIANILSYIDLEIEKLETKLEKYKNIKLGFMQELLTGKTRLIE